MNLEAEEGWLILDGRGRRWDSHLYKTQAAAEATASACVSGPYTVRHAKRVARWQRLATTLARPSAEYILSP